ncbi:hypothetical protein A2707_03180 [Candidatus Saccharibacteria bacterium RIFCSPHIGHO2_01_FULL_45_15]|nr:MAG: hypothetical protein A2707_03180 [Candidatus Saccharibacteria bacterium RIFCSPHIGHO2_01_FULL_45_15]
MSDTWKVWRMIALTDDVKRALSKSNAENDTKKHEGYRELMPLIGHLFLAEYQQLKDAKSIELEGIEIVLVPGKGEAAVVFTRNGTTLNGTWYRSYNLLVLLDRSAGLNGVLYEQKTPAHGTEMFQLCDLRALPDDWVRSYFGSICVKGGMKFEREMKAAKEALKKNPHS